MNHLILQKPRSTFQANYAKLIPFALIHLLCFAAFFVTFSTALLWTCLGLFVLRMFGITAGYHRYFSHRSYKTSRLMQFFLALLANLSLMRGPITWAAHHRYHHRYSDTEKDLHSPKQGGFLWSHMGWFLSKSYDETPLVSVRDLEAFPELVWLNRFYFLPAYALGALLFYLGGTPLFVWGFLISTVLTWHITFTINSLSHIFGRRRYPTPDDSRNNWFLALLTLGEGWHNNHHQYASSARQGFFWWEIDLSYYILWLMSRLGLIWDLKSPPAEFKTNAKPRVDSD